MSLALPLLGDQEQRFYPGLFPDIQVSPITLTAADRTITLEGEPLGSGQSFFWTLLLFDSEGSLVFSSEKLPSSKELVHDSLENRRLRKSIHIKSHRNFKQQNFGISDMQNPQPKS